MQRKPFSVRNNQSKTSAPGIFRTLENADLESFSGGDRGVFQLPYLDADSRSASGGSGGDDRITETITLNFAK